MNFVEQLGHIQFLVIVHNFNLIRAVFTPNKAHTPLVVDADAVLSLAIALERFELIARWYAKAGQISSRVKLQKLAPSHPLDVPEPRHRPALKKRLGVSAGKRMNHVQ
jgi:hypothetical protein